MHKAYKSGILDPDVHSRLVQDLAHISQTAGIPEVMVYTALNKFCSEEEIEWVVGIQKHRSKVRGGLVFIGASGQVENKMLAIAGACLRNFIDARVMALQDVLHSIKKDHIPQNSVLLIPNFFIGKGSGVAEWEINGLLSLLSQRRSRGNITIVYVESMKGLRQAYGDQISSYLTSYYSKFDL